MPQQRKHKKIEGENQLTVLERFKIQDEKRAFQKDFGLFFRESWKVMEPNIPLVWSPHYELQCEWGTYLASGQFKIDHPEKVGVWFCVPPRTAKSLVWNVSFPCWNWTFSQAEKFLCISYGAELSIPFSMKRRDLVLSDWYQRYWPKMQMREDMNLKTRFDNNFGGYMLAGTVGGAITGLGASRIILDDLLKAKDAYSEPLRIQANKLYDETLRSRLNSPARDFFIGVSQRLHPADIVGWLKEHEPERWVLIDIPMEEEDPSKVKNSEVR